MQTLVLAPEAIESSYLISSPLLAFTGRSFGVEWIWAEPCTASTVPNMGLAADALGIINREQGKAIKSRSVGFHIRWTDFF